MNESGCPICGKRPEVKATKNNFVCSSCQERAVDSFHSPVAIARKVTRTKHAIELGDVVAFNKPSRNFDAETATINLEVTKSRRCLIDGLAVEFFEDQTVTGLVLAEDQDEPEIVKAKSRQTQPCGICKQPVIANQRYPDYVCGRCQDRAVDSLHRPVITSNTELLGYGQIALLRDKPEGATERLPSEPANENYEIYIDGVKCKFEEARFGGIVVRPARLRD